MRIGGATTHGWAWGHGIGAAVGFGFLIIAGSASAQEYRGTEAQQAACTSDVFRLCWSEIPDVSRIVACLKHDRAQLSPDCRAVFGGPSIIRVAARGHFHSHHHFYEHHRHLSARDER